MKPSTYEISQKGACTSTLDRRAYAIEFARTYAWPLHRICRPKTKNCERRRSRPVKELFVNFRFYPLEFLLNSFFWSEIDACPLCLHLQQNAHTESKGRDRSTLCFGYRYSEATRSFDGRRKKVGWVVHYDE